MMGICVFFLFSDIKLFVKCVLVLANDGNFCHRRMSVIYYVITSDTFLRNYLALKT